MYSLKNHTLISDDRVWQPIDYKKSTCQPLADWQTQSFPNCNNIHEIHLHAVTPTANKSLPSLEYLSILAKGWFRTTWRLDRQTFPNNNNITESVVLKTLRMERDYSREYYELHRRDAVAMERLTSSPFVVNVYASCGNSAINELANFPFEGVQSLESFCHRLRGRDSPAVYNIKLRMAASIAVGLADVHGIDSSRDRPTLVHYDMNPRNVALFQGGRPKLNDFNVAEFLHYNPQTNQTCGFKSRFHEPWWRAPEEVLLDSDQKIDDKVDVYALGNILFYTLTTHSPQGKMKKERMEMVRAQVAAGVTPVLPPPYSNSTHPAAVAIRQVMKMCYEKDPSKRATAQQVADFLMEALISLEGKEEAVPEQQDWSRASGEEEDQEDSDVGEEEPKG